MSTAIVAFAVLSVCGTGFAAVHDYHNDYFFAVGDAFIFRGGREGLLNSSAEALKTWADFGQVAPGVSNGQSEIRIDKLEFHRPRNVASQYGSDEGWTGLVQAVVFEVNDRDKIGYSSPAGYRYCCTKELVPKTKCHLNRLIYQEGSNGWPKVIDIDFEDNQTIAKPFEATIPIQASGMYYLWFVHCDEELSAATVAGQTTWKNPGGYLPGMMYPHIAFFAVMSLAYLAVMVVWLLLYVRHWADIFMLQHFMMAVIVMGMLEMIAWYLDYATFNVTGRRPVLPTLWAVLVGCLRKTIARTLVVMVSMGYGVVLPFLTDVQKKQVLAFSSVYFISVTALDIITNVGAIDDLTSTARLVMLLPVAFLDAIFILWVFTSLSATLRTLQSRNTTVKLQLYRRFTNALAAWVWISAAWVAYEMYTKVTDQYNEGWRWDWVTSDFWHVLNFVFLCVLAFLWRPSASATRFAYSAVEDNDDLAALETGKPPPNGQTSPKRQTPRTRQPPVGNGFVHVDPEEAAKQN
ncbi:hypothetical protein ABBQ38_001244 [Trebouxia sp. C0009 RCD-2024]